MILAKEECNMAPLDTAGWAHNGSGEIVNGQTRSPEGIDAFFKHAQELQGGDVWRMRVVEGGDAFVGFVEEETEENTAMVCLNDGTTWINTAISQDGEEHYHQDHLEDHIPETKPYDVALRITKDGNLASDSIQRRQCVARLYTGRWGRIEGRAVVPLPVPGRGRPS